MVKIAVLLGKSAAGKDTIYRLLLAHPDLKLRRIVPYTTRPVRAGEEEGREYRFVTQEEARDLADAGKIIEQRTYQTVAGPWMYFTADDGQIDTKHGRYLVIGTLEAYAGFRAYFGDEALVPVYLYADDAERLLRSIRREQLQEAPNYAEICRRFLADEADFSEEKLREAGIGIRFRNDDPDGTADRIARYLAGEMK